MEGVNKNHNNRFFLYDDLLKSLGEKGFSVDIEDYVVATQLKDQLLDGSITFDQYKFYLAAIICRTEEEQRELYLLFESELQKKENELHSKHQILKQEIDDKYALEAEEERLRREKRRKNVIIVLSCFLFIAIGLLLFAPVVKTDDYKVEDFGSRSMGHITTDIPIEFSIYDNPLNLPKCATHESICARLFNKVADTTHLKVRWYIDGDTVANSTINYKFKTPGKKKVMVTFGDFDTIPKMYAEFTVCEPCPVINMPEKVYRGEDARFVAESSKNKPLVWIVDGQKEPSGDNVLVKQFEKGDHHISSKTEGQQCDHVDGCDQLFTVLDRNVFKIEEEVTPLPNPEPSFSSFFYTLVLLLGLLLLFLILTLFIPDLYEKYARVLQNYLRKLNIKKSEGYLNNAKEPIFIGNKPPIGISFFNKERLIKRKESIRQLGLDFQKRIATEDSKLNLPGTIKASIKNYGLITPFYQNKNKKQCYLIMIDTSYVNSPLVKLHIFVANYLKNSQADFDVYYYYKDPLKVYRNDPDATIDISTLKDKFYESILIVFGDGYNFLDANFDEIHKPTAKEYSYWAQRVLITPIPSDDWSVSEKTLASFLHIVPADDNGLLAVFPLLQKTSYNQKVTETKEYNTYSINYVDFENIDELRNYVTNNTKEGNIPANPLFQWVCAIAVYPKITWEMILAIGASIDENIVTYENVLKICRISWVQSSLFPTQIRLELLKNLYILIEIKARKAVITLLEEESVILPETFADNERKIQLTYNKFILYAIDPKQFLKYQDVEKDFLKLYQQEKLIDLPLKVYLQGYNPMKPDEYWKSPLEINEKKNLDHLEHYYNTKTNTLSKHSIAKGIKNVLISFCLLAIVCLSAIILIGAHDLGKKTASRFVEMQSNIASLPSPWEITLIKGDCFDAYNPHKLIIMDGARIVYNENFPLKGATILLKDFQSVYGHELTVQFTSDSNEPIIKTIKAGQKITLKITSDDCMRNTEFYGNDYESYKDILETKPLQTKNFASRQIANSIIFKPEVDSAEVYKLCLDLIKKKFPLQEITMAKYFTLNEVKDANTKLLITWKKSSKKIITTERDLDLYFYGNSYPKIEIIYFPTSNNQEAKIFYDSIIKSNFKYATIKINPESTSDAEFDNPQEGMFVYNNKLLKASSALNDIALKSTGRKLKIIAEAKSDVKYNTIYVLFFKKITIRIDKTDDYQKAMNIMNEEEFWPFIDINPDKKQKTIKNNINYFYYKSKNNKLLFTEFAEELMDSLKFKRVKYKSDIKYDIEIGYDKQYDKCAVLTPNDLDDEKFDCEPISSPCIPVASNMYNYTVYFDYDKVSVRADMAIELVKIVDILKQYPTSDVEIVTYSNSGTEAYSLSLSDRRGKSVVDWLIKQGINGERMTSIGKGKTGYSSKNENCFNRSEIKINNANKSPVDNTNPNKATTPVTNPNNTESGNVINVPTGENYSAKGRFLYYGDYGNGKWPERYFKNKQGEMKFPAVGDEITSTSTVNIREQVKQYRDGDWEDPKIIGVLSKGSNVKVIKVITIAGGNFVWVEYEIKNPAPSDAQKMPIRNAVKK
jgi:outer membrane protein OmpA-like peptidoglycan-associated protein